MVSVVVSVKNEIKHLPKFFASVLCDSNVSEVVITDDFSVDGSKEYIADVARGTAKVCFVESFESPSLNHRLLKLMHRTRSNLIHLRTPHDFYAPDFYAFHKRRLAKNQNLRSSFNYVTLRSRKFNFMVPIDFSTKFSHLNSLLFNLNLSSCGFIADKKTLIELWCRYEKFGPYCDWLVKKDLSHNYPWVFSTRCLSTYNDEVKSSLFLTEANFEYLSKVRDECHARFWLENPKKRLVDPKFSLDFFLKVAKQRSILWKVVYIYYHCFLPVKGLVRFLKY